MSKVNYGRFLPRYALVDPLTSMISGNLILILAKYDTCDVNCFAYYQPINDLIGWWWGLKRPISLNSRWRQNSNLMDTPHQVYIHKQRSASSQV